MVTVRVSDLFSPLSPVKVTVATARLTLASVPSKVMVAWLSPPELKFRPVFWASVNVPLVTARITCMSPVYTSMSVMLIPVMSTVPVSRA